MLERPRALTAIDDSAQGRTYRSPRRSRQQVETRRAVLDAAVTLFSEHGYQGTTISMIAAASNRSVSTVNAYTGGKTRLLAALVDDLVSQAVPHSAVNCIRAAESGCSPVCVLAEATRRVFETHEGIFIELYDNASTDRQLSSTLAMVEQTLFRLAGEVVETLSRSDSLRSGLAPERARHVISFYFGFRSWRELRRRDWTWSDAEKWIHGEVCKIIVAGDSDGS